MSDNYMSDNWAIDPSLNNYNFSNSDSIVYPEGYQLAQNQLAMGSRPYQNLSGHSYQTHPQDTTTSRQISADQHQQYGSGTPSQPGYGVVHLQTASPWAFQAPQTFPQGHVQQATFWQADFQQATFQGADFQQAPVPHPQAAIQHPQAALPHPQAALPQAAIPHPQAAIPHPQATIPHPQAAIPHPQAAIQHPQAALPHPQAALPQAAIPHPQATIPHPQAAIPHPQATIPHPQAALPQAAIPHPQATIPLPQEPQSTFEQKIAAIPPVPEPHEEPVPRPGPGRKKKLQRFWAPQGANQETKRRYARLQTVDHRVTLAERKLARNNKPSETEHLQNILLRNMRERDNLWKQCQREEQGLVAVELPLEQAEAQAKKCHKVWTEEWQRYSARVNSLRAEYPQAVDDSGNLDGKRLSKKNQQGLQTMSNWIDNKWHALRDSISTLWTTLQLTHGADPAGQDASVMRIHELGCYDAWSHWAYPGESQDMIDLRTMYSNPDPSTWVRVDQVHPEQPLEQGHQVDQPENGQSAEPPRVNHEPGAGLDHTTGIDAQYTQDQYQPQMQQAPIPEEDQEGLVEITLEAAEAEIAAWNGQQDQLQGQEAIFNDDMPDAPQVTHAEGTAELDAFFPDEAHRALSEDDSLFGDPADEDAPHEPDPDYPEQQPEQPDPYGDNVQPAALFQADPVVEEAAAHEGPEVTFVHGKQAAEQETQPQDGGDIEMSDEEGPNVEWEDVL